MSTTNLDEAYREWVCGYVQRMKEVGLPEHVITIRRVGAFDGWMALQQIVESNAWAETVNEEKVEVVPMTTVETATERALLKTIGILTDHIDALQKGQEVPLAALLQESEG